MDQKVSIIIPAHNEYKVIKATLTALLPGISKRFIEAVVVCNGCTDNTAQMVASIDPSITCIQTPIASKPHALNLGDREARWFPRIYQDADVVLTMDAVAKLATVLRNGAFLAASPAMRMEYHEASWVVRSYYETWQRLPYVREGMIGTGVYALSEQGRQRFDDFPELIADDGYVRALFQPHERTSVNDCWSLVRAPKNLQGLLKIKTRSRRGRYELAQKFPELMRNEKKDYGKALLPLMRKVTLWPKMVAYLYVNIAARLMAKNRFGPGGVNKRWERDESSREAVIRE